MGEHWVNELKAGDVILLAGALVTVLGLGYFVSDEGRQLSHFRLQVQGQRDWFLLSREQLIALNPLREG